MDLKFSQSNAFWVLSAWATYNNILCEIRKDIETEKKKDSKKILHIPLIWPSPKINKGNDHV